MAEDKFKLPGSSYQELVKIIRAYLPFSSPASLDEVSKAVGIHTTIISRNNGFLIGFGVLEGGQKKLLTEKGRDLARALDFDMPEDIESQWRSLAIESEFVSKILTAVRIRGGMDQSTLQSHIAYSAGQPKAQHVLTGSGSCPNRS